MTALLGSASALLELNVDGFVSSADRAYGSMDQLQRKAQGGGSWFNGLVNGALKAGDALALPFGIGISFAADLEQNLADLNASLDGLDTATLDALSDSITQIGADSKFSANEVALVADELAKAGFNAEKIIGGSLETIVQLSQATGETLETSTAGVIQAMALWNPELVGVEIGLTDVTAAADIFTIAANASAGGVTDIIGGFRNFGGSAVAAKLSMEDTAAAIAFFTNMGFSGEEAGTKLSRAIQMLAAPTAEAAGWLEQLGVEAFNAQGEFVGFPALFDQLNMGLTDLTDEEAQRAFKSIFGAEAFDAMLLGAQAGGEGLRVLRGEFDRTGVAAEQSALRMDTLRAQWQSFLEGLSTRLGQLFGVWRPIFRRAVDFGNAMIDAFGAIPEPIIKIIGLAGGLLAMFSIATRSVQTWQLLNGVLGSVGGNAAAASISLGRLAAVFGVAGLAVAGLTLAYGTNFGGFRDLVDGVVGRIQAFIGAFNEGREAFQNLFAGVDRAIASSPLGQLAGVVDHLDAGLQSMTGAVRSATAPLQYVTAGMTWMGDSFRSASESISPVTQVFYGFGYALERLGLGSVGRGIQNLAVNFELLGDFVSDLWRGGPRTALEAYERLPNRLKPFAKVIGSGVQAVNDLRAAFSRGGFRELAISLPASLGSIGGAVEDAFRDLTGRGITDWTLNVAAPTLGGWIVQVGRRAFDALIDLAGWAGGKVLQFGDWAINTAVPTVVGWITSAAEDFWTLLRRAAGWTGEIASRLMSWSLDVVAPKVTGWLVSAAENFWYKIRQAAGWTGDIVVKLLSWTIQVGVPKVVWEGPSINWDPVVELEDQLAGRIAEVTDLVVEIDGETLGYQVGDVVQGLVKAITNKIQEDPVFVIKALVTFSITSIAFLFFGVPGALATWLAKEIPAEVFLGGVSIVAEIGKLAFALGGLSLEILGGLETSLENWLNDNLPTIDIPVIDVQIGAWELLTLPLLALSPVIWLVVNGFEKLKGLFGWFKDTVFDFGWIDNLATSFGAVADAIGKIVGAITSAPDWIQNTFLGKPGNSESEQVKLPDSWSAWDQGIQGPPAGPLVRTLTPQELENWMDQNPPPLIEIGPVLPEDEEEETSKSINTLFRLFNGSTGPKNWNRVFNRESLAISRSMDGNLSVRSLARPVDDSFVAVNRSAAINFSAAQLSGTRESALLGRNVTRSLSNTSLDGSRALTSLATAGVLQFTGLSTGSTLQAQTMETSVGRAITTMQRNSAVQFGNIALQALSSSLGMATSWKNGADLAVLNVKNSLTKIPGVVAASGSMAALSAFGIGLNIGMAWANGINAALPLIRNAATNAANAANDAARQGFGIRSPSRVWTGFADNVSSAFIDTLWGERTGFAAAGAGAAAAANGAFDAHIPNRGSGRVGTGTSQSTVQVFHVNNSKQLRSEEFNRILQGSEKGATAYDAAFQSSRRRTMRDGAGSKAGSV